MASQAFKQGAIQSIIELDKKIEECKICFEMNGDPVVLKCAHVLCFSCFTSMESKCPFCRQAIVKKDVLRVAQ